MVTQGTSRLAPSLLPSSPSPSPLYAFLSSLPSFSPSSPLLFSSIPGSSRATSSMHACLLGAMGNTDTWKKLLCPRNLQAPFIATVLGQSTHGLPVGAVLCSWDGVDSMPSETILVHFSIVIPTVVMAPCSAEAAGCSCEFVSWATLGSLGWPCYGHGQWVISLLNVSGSFVPMHSRNSSSSYQLPVGSRSICWGSALALWEIGAVQQLKRVGSLQCPSFWPPHFFPT